ncbi:small acid-soluble spore protein H (minor) [Caloramator quimbayensis]|uniref:Small acid-soluble spore protein H (Minor) n=1 Tax=Caloramator quimbayensis TaxID=1147123 RepID=A0A1T4Y8D3_9CLOT|nr:H-type small acid-soluble spore protein [Caloramator quimbayensis]SKA97986.1 small acid-soluble spore protein H (minor) [Caloramator quimbayensis]
MLLNRAKEIINSPYNIEVVYNNKPVWLESVNENSVKVKDLSSGNIMDVPASQLKETDIIK